MKSPAVTRLGRNVRRTGDIIAVLAKYGLADWVKGLDLPWIRDRLRSVGPFGGVLPVVRTCIGGVEGNSELRIALSLLLMVLASGLSVWS